MLHARLTRLRGALQRGVARLAAPSIVRRVSADALTYLEPAALRDLYDVVRAAGRERVPGVLIEVGCALGGSALVMAAARTREYPLQLYDVFGMPPAPTAGDGPDAHGRYAEIASGRSPGIGGGVYYGYVEHLLEQVRATFARYGFDPDRDRIEFIQGMVQDMLPSTGPVAVAHVDCDRYASVRTCLERIAPRLSPRGVLVVDDYEHKSGCRRAVDEYFRGREAEYRFVHRSRLHITRM